MKLLIPLPNFNNTVVSNFIAHLIMEVITFHAMDNGISYIGKMTSLYWIRAQDLDNIIGDNDV